MDKTVSLLLNELLKREIISKDKTDIYKVGLELIVADVINTILIIGVSLITNTFISGCLYMLVFCGVRKFCGGFHAKTYWLCRLVTVFTYLIIIAVSSVLSNNLLQIVLVCDIVTVISMFLFAPVRHPNKELKEKEIKANKLFAILSASGFSILSVMLILFERKEGLNISLNLFAISILMYIGMIINNRRKEERK